MLYYISSSGALDLLSDDSQLGKVITEEEIKNKKNTLPDYVNLFWIIDFSERNPHIMNIPWGIEGFNGVVQAAIANKEKFIKQYASSSWERETRDGVTYEYLSEYFINSNSEQSGLSIELRDLFLWHINRCIKAENATQEQLIKALEDNGPLKDTLEKAGIRICSASCNIKELTTGGAD